MNGRIKEVTVVIEALAPMKKDYWGKFAGVLWRWCIDLRDSGLQRIGEAGDDDAAVTIGLELVEQNSSPSFIADGAAVSEPQA